ncbi:MAG TPA: cytoplasmic protein [Elusimicrobia bacterium]|nr:cytoplasmic protein [Elusimicrobiota bacterium]
MNFQNLINLIVKTQANLQGRALQAVNQSLTIRNWLFGWYIVEYEQKGEDRAKYGKKLLVKLALELKKKNIQGLSLRNLKLFRQFYFVYPSIGQTLSAQFINSFSFPRFMQNKKLLSSRVKGFSSLNISDEENDLTIGQTVSAQLAKQHGLPLKSYSPAPELLLRHFTFSHFVELLGIGKPLKRAFYEVEAIKGNWSVRQLKRQIESLLYERTGLSKNKKGLLVKVHKQKDNPTVEDAIRDPYVLEFTGLKERAEYSETDLETALLNHIQEFLLELGNGFCFEARQKRITIDNEHDRIDLVFYHRILRCHVLIDLKNRAFSHADAGQMNFYLNYYKENEIKAGDNPPFGIILCTDKNKVKVKYATTGLDNKLFVSKYLVALPSEKELEDFISKDKKLLEG